MKKPIIKDDKVDISKYRLVMVIWVDIVSECSWDSLSEATNMEPAECVEIGWLVHEDKKKIILVSQFNDTDCGNRTVLPRSVVKKIEVL